MLLTDQAELLLAALEACPALRLASALQISLYGRHPTMYVLHTSAMIAVHANTDFRFALH